MVTLASFVSRGRNYDPNLWSRFLFSAMHLSTYIFEPQTLTHVQVRFIGLQLQSSSDRSSVTSVVSYF